MAANLVPSSPQVGGPENYCQAMTALIVAGEIRINPDHMAAAWAALEPMVAATRAEAGCLAYVFSEDHSEPGLLHLFERWTSKAALDEHFASDHMATYRAAMGDIDIRRRDIAIYDVSGTTQLP